MNGVIPGRIVHYVLTDQNAVVINTSRLARTGNLLGVQYHEGSHASEGDHVPMIMTGIFQNYFGPGQPAVNGQCFLDGNDSLWVRNCRYDENKTAGTWHWIEKA